MEKISFNEDFINPHLVYLKENKNNEKNNILGNNNKIIII